MESLKLKGRKPVMNIKLYAYDDVFTLYKALKTYYSCQDTPHPDSIHKLYIEILNRMKYLNIIEE